MRSADGADTPKERALLDVARESLGLPPSTFGPLVGLARDTDTARKYIAFGEKPEGTVGRAYFDRLFTVALQFQVGLVISPFAPGVPDAIDPRRFVLHNKRGSPVNADLSTEWRFEDDRDRPLADVRARYGVIPIEDVRL